MKPFSWLSRLRHQMPTSQRRLWREGRSVPGSDGDIQKRKVAFLQGQAGASLKCFYHVAQTDTDFSSMIQVPRTRDLQKYLGTGEYPSFQSIAMFESNFVQVTRKGKHIFIHNHCNAATVGIASTNAKLPLPNVMFIARPAEDRPYSGQAKQELILTRLLPLKFVRISIHDLKKQLIKIKLANGHSYYLQLYASAEDQEALFERWLGLVSLLDNPPPSYLQANPKSYVRLDDLSIHVIPSDEEEDEVQEDSVWSKEEASQPKEDAARSANANQALKDLQKEAFSAYEQQTLRTMSRLTRTEQGEESFESFQGSSDIQNRSWKSSSNMSAAEGLSALTLSRSALPPSTIPPGKGPTGSLNIITIFSNVSKTLLSKRELGTGGQP